MSIHLPNFLVVGAAKSGTTSLYEYLREHPEVYMSPNKEPTYFLARVIDMNFDGIPPIEPFIVETWDEYVALFNDVTNEKAIGTASWNYLYKYNEAIPSIKEKLGDVKIIIILRNPAERAFSHYNYFRMSGLEPLPTFEEALEQEEQRIAENWRYDYHLKGIGMYHQQVKAYLENFSQVKVYLFEDLKEDPVKLMQDAYRFLDTDPTFIPDIERHNMSGVPKSDLLNRMIVQDFPLKNVLVNTVSSILGKENYLELKDKVRRKNLRRSSMDPQTRKYLVNYFKEDIIALQQLIGCDLSKWLE